MRSYFDAFRLLLIMLILAPFIALAADHLVVIDGATGKSSSVVLPDCRGPGQVLNYNNTTKAFVCNVYATTTTTTTTTATTTT